MRILIAEDEVSITKALKVMLERNKYVVDAVYNGTDAVDYACTNVYDALILDIMMPGMDGIAALTAIRRSGVTTPALFLTAKSEVEDRVAGLDAGADDYLPKPFAASEFLARVRALIRRSGGYAPALLRLGNTTLDCGQYTLSTPAGSLRLNNKEYQLMELFLRHPRQVFSSEHLMQRLWSMDSAAEMDVIWTYIGFLRKKLKLLEADVEIRTIRGAGYALEELSC
ncbi:MAG: response regulator transcription factor [Oscillospiraceae bacterium]|nr:response regulator transcription factor [Oscillospiraceae bacterium]